jgi:hypothetical protein
MPSFCTQCGKVVDKDVAFCVVCGAKLQTGTSAQKPATASETTSLHAVPGNATPAPPGGALLKVLALVAGALVVVGGLAMIGVIYAGYQASSKASQIQQHSSLGALIKTVTAVARAESGSTEKQTAASERDVCSLISKAEVTAATGVAVSEATNNEDKDVCTYEPADDNAVIVVVDVKWHNGDLAMRALSGFSKQLGQEDIRHPVHGIGDEAYLLGVDQDTQNGLDQASQALKGLSSFATGPLTFRKGEVWVAVTATMSENKAEVEKKIASIVAARI